MMIDDMTIDAMAMDVMMMHRMTTGDLVIRGTGGIGMLRSTVERASWLRGAWTVKTRVEGWMGK